MASDFSLNDQANEPEDSPRSVETPEEKLTIKRWRLTREGVGWVLITTVLLTAGLFKTINLLILLGYLMLSMIALNVGLAYRSAHRVTARRVPTPHVFSGQPLVRTFVVANQADKGASVGVFESSLVHADDVFAPALRPGEERWAEARLPPTARGRYATSPVWVVAGYPFGLVTYSVAAAPPETLTVLPAVGHVDIGMLRRWLIRTGAGDNRTRRPVRFQSNSLADVRGVRTYRPGDSPRDIHWKTTARRNELMVREYDSTEPLDLVLVVDSWMPAQALPAQREQFESVIQLAASVFWAWCHTEETPHVTLILAGPNGDFRAGRGTPGYGREALTLLAGAVGVGANPILPAEPLRRKSNRCARILVSSRASSPVSDELRRISGVPFVLVDVNTPIAWYTPPTVLKRS